MADPLTVDDAHRIIEQLEKAWRCGCEPDIPGKCRRCRLLESVMDAAQQIERLQRMCKAKDGIIKDADVYTNSLEDQLRDLEDS